MFVPPPTLTDFVVMNFPTKSLPVPVSSSSSSTPAVSIFVSPIFFLAASALALASAAFFFASSDLALAIAIFSSANFLDAAALSRAA